MLLTLPYPISTNRYWRTFRGRQVVSAEARAYKAAAALAARLAGVEVLPGRVAVAMVLSPAMPKRWKPGAPVRCVDVDNAQKVALDSLNGVAWTDDSQIVDLHIVRGEPVPGGRLTVTVEPA